MKTSKLNLMADAPATGANTVLPSVTHNGIKVELKRTETERVKEGKEATAYYTVDLSQFYVAPKLTENMTEEQKAEAVETAQVNAVDTLRNLFTYDTLLEYQQAKLNQNIRAAQMDAGKDIYDMSAKLTYATTYVTGGFGATRQQQKSPMELATVDYQNEIGALREKLNAKLITQEVFVKGASEALNKMQLKLVEISTALATALTK